MKTTLTGLSFLSLISFVAAHGYLQQIAIDGKIYRGNIPQNTNFPSPIRLVDTIDPVKGAMNRAVNCGQNAQIAELVADAQPGSEILFDWAGGVNELWPHNTGPILTYLSKCANTTCDQFDAINAQWFKIDQAGQKPNDSQWFQQEIMNGNTYVTNLPNNLAPGDYLVRHEIIGLHIADKLGGAEFYPSCTQIRVGGNQTGVPVTTVSLPGAYNDSSSSLFAQNFFDVGIDYPFPGPAIDANLFAAGNAIADPAPKTNGLPDPTGTASAAPSATSFASDDDDASCDDEEDENDGSATTTSSAPLATSTANNAVASGSSTGGYTYRPRQISHVMRRHYLNF